MVEHITQLLVTLCIVLKEMKVIYIAKDVEVEIRVDGGKWERVKLTGSLREPSATLNMPNEGKHVVEVRAINEEIALNMISTDGVFYRASSRCKA